MGNELVKIDKSSITDSVVPLFKRQEKNVAKVTLVALAATALGTLGYFHVPELLFNATWTLTKLGMLVGGIFGGVTVLTSKKVQNAFKLYCYYFYDLAVESLDPAVRCEFAMNEQQKVISQLDEKQSIVTGYVGQLEGAISENEDKIQNCEETIRVTQRGRNTTEKLALAESSEQLQLLLDSNKLYAQNLAVFREMDAALADLVVMAKSAYRRYKTRREVLIQNRRVTQGARGAAEGIRALLSDNAINQIGDRAERQMLEEINRDIGFFKNLVRETSGVTAEMDIQKSINIRKALERINTVKANNAVLVGEYREIKSLPENNSTPFILPGRKTVKDKIPAGKAASSFDDIR